jgi:recombination associated protein RdgC
MFKSIRIYKIAEDWTRPSGPAIEAALKKFAFAPLGATEKESVGFVSPRPQDHSPLLEVINGQWILKVQKESKSVPAGALKKAIAARVKKIEDGGRKVGRKEKKELKEEVELTLLPRAFSKTAATLAWLDVANHRLIVGSSSQKAADDVVAAIIEATQEAGSIIQLSQLQTQQSPSASMSQWLVDKEAPAGFSLDRDLELRQPDEEKSAVRYARHNLEIDEVVEHIKSGKIPTQVAMTWDGRVSFVLGADSALKRIELLDEVFKDVSEDEFNFDGDVTIATGELAKLIPDLVAALGGELVIE